MHKNATVTNNTKRTRVSEKDKANSGHLVIGQNMNAMEKVISIFVLYVLTLKSLVHKNAIIPAFIKMCPMSI